jgi:hypothetical protein
MSEIIEATSEEFDPGAEGSFFGHFVMESLVAYCNASKISWPFGQRLEIVLTINGQEVPLRPAVDAIEKNLNRLVLHKAEELLRTKLSSAQEALDNIDKYLRTTFYTMKSTQE